MEPKMRFNGFQGEWEDQTFNETFDFLKNNSLSRDNLSTEGSVMNIHYGDILIKFGECIDVIKDEIPYVKDESVAKSLMKAGTLHNGDVIIADAAEDNTVGKCAELVTHDGETVVSGLHTIAIRPKQKFAIRYLGYYMNSSAYHNQLLPHIQGTKISSISKKAVSSTHIDFPVDIPEQRALATFFTSLDRQISGAEGRLASLKQVKAASLQAMFPQNGETTPKLRFKGCTGEWKKVKLGEVFEHLKNNSLSRDNLATEGLVMNIHYGDVLIKYGECIDTCHDEIPYIKDAKLGKAFWNIGSLQSGDIIMADAAEDNTVGKCSELITDNAKVVSGLHTIAIRPKQKFASCYLGYYMNSPSYHNQLLTHIQGSKISSITKKAVDSTYIHYPNEEFEQRQIAAYFTSLDRQISAQSAQITKLKQIKAACLDQMFV